MVYFSVRSNMSIVAFDGPPSWSLDLSKTGESTKCSWVGVIRLIVWGWRSRKNRETVTASLCLESTNWNFNLTLHASELVGFAAFFWVREEFFCSIFIRLNLVSNCTELISWTVFTWRPWIDVSKFTAAQQHVIDIIFPWFDRFFLQGERLLIDLISRGAKIWPHPLYTRQSETVTFSLCFLPAMPSTTPTHGRFLLPPVLLTSRHHDFAACRTQQLTSTILREKKGTVHSL